MIEQIGGFIGMLAADVRNFFRGRQAVPCTVDWPREEYIDTDEFFDELADNSRVYLIPNDAFADPNAPTVAEINNAIDDALHALNDTTNNLLHGIVGRTVNERLHELAESINDRFDFTADPVNDGPEVAILRRQV